jgi:hypothetical protein
VSRSHRTGAHGLHRRAPSYVGALSVPAGQRPEPRVCGLEGCSADLNELGKRPKAIYCSPSHRAAASDVRRGVRPMPTRTPPKPQSMRRKRPGVSVYLPDLGVASGVLPHVRGLAQRSEEASVQVLLEALERAIERRGRRGQ